MVMCRMGKVRLEDMVMEQKERKPSHSPHLGLGDRSRAERGK